MALEGHCSRTTIFYPNTYRLCERLDNYVYMYERILASAIYGRACTIKKRLSRQGRSTRKRDGYEDVAVGGSGESILLSTWHYIVKCSILRHVDQSQCDEAVVLQIRRLC